MGVWLIEDAIYIVVEMRGSHDGFNFEAAIGIGKVLIYC